MCDGGLAAHHRRSELASDRGIAAGTITQQLSEYGESNAGEFVSEVFSALLNDLQIPWNLMDAYRQFYGWIPKKDCNDYVSATVLVLRAI